MGEQWIPTVRYCLHCGKKLVGYMDKDGKVKMRCAHCSASIVSKRIGRRHETLDVFRPKSEEVQTTEKVGRLKERREEVNPFSGPV
ncbi:MAG: hypothetical protein ACLUHK_02360 [Eubacteriales bacterium]